MIGAINGAVPLAIGETLEKLISVLSRMEFGF